VSRLGVVAVGDSITRGHGEPARGVHAQSWAQWLAEALELPFTNLAADGARAPDVVRDQLPRLRASYDVGCVFVGVNDCRGLDWDPAAFARGLEAIVEVVGSHASRVVLCTVPVDLGRPRAAPKPLEANGIIRRIGGKAGAVVVSLDDLTGHPLVLPDAVHPSALGQVEIAGRAASALATAGLSAGHDPWALATPVTSRRAHLAYARRWSSLLARDLVRRTRERLHRPSGTPPGSDPL